MIAFLGEHYQWLFSGIGVTVFYIVYKHLKNRKNKVPNKITTKYSTKDASEFYSQIVDWYDDRNSNYLIESHRAICDIVEAHLDRSRNQVVRWSTFLGQPS